MTAATPTDSRTMPVPSSGGFSMASPTKRQCAAAHDEDDDDHEERDRVRGSLEERRDPDSDLQVSDLGFENADQQASEQRQREGAEPADERRGERGHDQQRRAPALAAR